MLLCDLNKSPPIIPPVLVQESPWVAMAAYLEEVVVNHTAGNNKQKATTQQLQRSPHHMATSSQSLPWCCVRWLCCGLSS